MQKTIADFNAFQKKLEEEKPEARKEKTKEQVIKKLLDDARKDDSK